MHLNNCSGLKVALKPSSFDGLFLFLFCFFVFFLVDSRCNLI